MPDLQFDTQENEFGQPPRVAQGGDITGKLLEWGLVGNRQQAEYVLIGLGVLALIVAYFLFTSGGSSVPPPPPVAV